MALRAPKGNAQSNAVEQPLIEADVYPGYLVQLIDLGLQPQRPFQGKEKPPAQEIMLTYELADVFMLDGEGNELEDKPRWISESLPFFGLFADRAKSTLRYKAFDPTEAWGGDFSQAIGMPCNITLVNNVKGDKTYTNIANIASMSAKKAANLPEIKNPTKCFDLDEPDLELFQSLPTWIQDKIKSNLNYKGSKLEALLGKGSPAPKENKKVEEEDDDTPY